MLQRIMNPDPRVKSGAAFDPVKRFADCEGGFAWRKSACRHRLRAKPHARTTTGQNNNWEDELDRRSCLTLTALGAAGLAMSLPARAAGALPIVLYVDLSVDPAKEKQFLAAYHDHFKPVARKHEGYVDLTVAKIDKVLQGTGPAKSVNYRFQLTWASEELRQKWVASADHVANWPLLEKTLADKNYTVILTHAV